VLSEPARGAQDEPEGRLLMEGVEPRPSRQSTGYSLHSPRDLSGRDQGRGSWHLRIEYPVDTATVLLPIAFLSFLRDASVSIANHERHCSISEASNPVPRTSFGSVPAVRDQSGCCASSKSPETAVRPARPVLLNIDCSFSSGPRRVQHEQVMPAASDGDGSTRPSRPPPAGT
jgi:hypothetical protein